MEKPASISYFNIRENEAFLFKRKISKRDVIGFAKLSGDFNPLHIDEDYGKKSIFKNNIVHGMLAGSLFSALIGMHCPGEKGLYLSQTLNFKLPIYYNDTVTVKGTVLHKNDAIKVITLKTEILKDDKVAVYGEAKVKVLE